MESEESSASSQTPMRLFEFEFCLSSSTYCIIEMLPIQLSESEKYEEVLSMFDRALQINSNSYDTLCDRGKADNSGTAQFSVARVGFQGKIYIYIDGKPVFEGKVMASNTVYI